MIPYLDLRKMHHDIKGELNNAINTVLQNEWYILGNELSYFEEESHFFRTISTSPGSIPAISSVR